jgi:hypothetical protein
VAASTLPLCRLLVALSPPRWLLAGIPATAVADVALIVLGIYGPVAAKLDVTPAPARLPSLQQIQLGPMTMGYADLFLPVLVGAVLASHRRRRRRLAARTLVLGLLCAPLLAVWHPFPATVPVAAALAVERWRRRRPSAYFTHLPALARSSGSRWRACATSRCWRSSRCSVAAPPSRRSSTHRA